MYNLVFSNFILDRYICRIYNTFYKDFLVISGVWLSAFSLGNFVGPTIAGCLVQTQGFRMTTLVFFVLYALMILVDVCEYIHTVKRDRIRDQYENL